MTATMLQRVGSTKKEKTDRKKRGCAKTKLRAAMQHAVCFKIFYIFCIPCNWKCLSFGTQLDRRLPRALIIVREVFAELDKISAVYPAVSVDICSGRYGNA